MIRTILFILSLIVFIANLGLLVAGFRHISFGSDAGEPYVLSLWGTTIILGSFAWILSIQIRRRRQRTRAGVCQNCGYDLQGSIDQCPECNTPFEKLS